ncbi:MAG: hypothetical protein ACRESK_06170 [Gammaproteobacteria bacterium]
MDRTVTVTPAGRHAMNTSLQARATLPAAYGLLQGIIIAAKML